MNTARSSLALRVPALTLFLALAIVIVILWLLPDDHGALRKLSGGGFIPWWVLQGIIWLWLPCVLGAIDTEISMPEL